MARFYLALAAALFALPACAPVAPVGNVAPAPLGMETVSSDQFESHPAFDPITGDVYFVRSSPRFQGWRIWRSRCTASGLGTAEPAPFGGPGVEADPFFSPDGRTFYFISSRPDPPAKSSPDLDIWTMSRNPSGGWSAPVRLPAPVNSPGAEWFPRLAGDGRLYFGSDRPGGRGQTDIYMAQRRDGAWRVDNVGGEVSTSGDEYEFEPARNGRFAVLMADGQLFRIARDGQGWGGRTALATGRQGFHVGPLLSPTGRTLLFANATTDRSGEIFRLSLAGNERWSRACAAPSRR